MCTEACRCASCFPSIPPVVSKIAQGAARSPSRAMGISQSRTDAVHGLGLASPHWTLFVLTLTPGVLPRSDSGISEQLELDFAESHSMQKIPSSFRAGIARLLVQQCLPWHTCLVEFIQHMCTYCRRTSEYLSRFVDGAFTQLDNLRSTCESHTDVINSVTTRAGELTTNLQILADRM